VAEGRAAVLQAEQFRTEASDQGGTLAAALRVRLPAQSWNAVRRLCATGKVWLDGRVVVDPAHRLEGICDVAIVMTAPRPRKTVDGFRVVFEDSHLIVIEKPAGISSVPFEAKETGTAVDLIREHWRSQRSGANARPLHTVHRIDKETSGLLCFAKSQAGARGLHQIFQRHLSSRTYLAVAHGVVRPGRIESQLVPDRGDRMRGSTRNPHLGQRAITNVEVVEALRDATLCRIRLEAGRTHQIRIHLAEAGHPLVGDSVYTHDRAQGGYPLIASRRMLLHAATLGFTHPVSGEALAFDSALPDEFTRMLEQLGRPGPRA
jgi:23S rRNA pseudouridine1911/1915/1917 synthase